MFESHVIEGEEFAAVIRVYGHGFAVQQGLRPTSLRPKFLQSMGLQPMGLWPKGLWP